MRKTWKFLKISLVTGLLILITSPINAYYIPVGTRQYQGLSTEAKPTEGVSKGSSFTELDTSKLFIYNGTTWYEQSITQLTDIQNQIIIAQEHLDDLEVLILEHSHNTQIFPSATNLTSTLTANISANVWSAWAELEDSAATTFSSLITTLTHITSIFIEWASVTDKLFMIEVSYGNEKTNLVRLRFTSGERVFLPPIHQMRIRSAPIPSGKSIYYRMMAETGGATARISLRYHHHE